MYKNFLTGVEYTNSNWETLAESGFSNPNFLTFKQAQMAGLKIKKGSKGIELKRVVIKKQKDKNGVEVEKKLIKKFYVFNLEQTEKFEEKPVQVEPEQAPETITFEYCQEESIDMGETNDCTVKALAIAGNIAYKKAHDYMRQAGRKMRRGLRTPSIEKGFNLAGFKLKRVGHTGKTVTTITQDCAKSKRYVAITARHILAITNGQVQDWTDGRRHRIETLFEVVKD
jgi:hypothetical protein